MTDLEKDLAIYQALSEIADNVFNEVMQNNKGLQLIIRNYGGFVSLTDILKSNGDFSTNFFLGVRDSKSGTEEYDVNVDTFSCHFPGSAVFELLKTWKSFANVKGEQIFIYEEKIENEKVGSVEVAMNGNNAKLIVKHAAKDVLRPIMNYVVAEINASNSSINFVASDGHTMSVISNNPSSIFAESDRPQTIYQAMFTPDDFKRICDYAKKNKGNVMFDIYAKKDHESFDTFMVDLGGIWLRSSVPDGRYPNWKSVIPRPDVLVHRFNIIPEERKAAQDWIKNLKADNFKHVNVSFYRGSDLVYFDFDNFEYDITKTATFHLTRPSDVTIGVAYKVKDLMITKFTGFNIENDSLPTVISCEESDIMLMMPVLSDDRVRDREHREVVAVEVAEAA